MRCFGGAIGAGLWGLCVLVCVTLFLSACVSGDALASEFKDAEDTYSDNPLLQLIKLMQSNVGFLLLTCIGWMLLTTVEIVTHKMGVDVVAAATFFTAFTLCGHAVTFLFASMYVDEMFVAMSSGSDHENAKEHMKKYQATYAVSFIAAVVLALYGAFLLFIRRQEAGSHAPSSLFVGTDVLTLRDMMSGS